MTKKEILEKLKNGELYCFFEFSGRYTHFGHKQYVVQICDASETIRPILELETAQSIIEVMNDARKVAILELEWAIEAEKDLDQSNDLPF